MLSPNPDIRDVRNKNPKESGTTTLVGVAHRSDTSILIACTFGQDRLVPRGEPRRILSSAVYTGILDNAQ